jgi:hypothetical protein
MNAPSALFGLKPSIRLWLNALSGFRGRGI